MNDPRRKPLVVRKDPSLRQGGRVPMGVLPPGARPASGVRAPATDQHDDQHEDEEPTAANGRPADLATIVSAGGGFYDRASLSRWLGLDETELDVRARLHALLALRTGDGATVYPIWQFTPMGGVVPFLTDVLRALAAGIDDPWTWALWLTAPVHDGQTPIDILRAGGDPRPLYDEASNDAARWSS